jgi:translation elongation factor EF-Tu-like GTPase
VRVTAPAGSHARAASTAMQAMKATLSPIEHVFPIKSRCTVVFLDVSRSRHQTAAEIE